MKISYDAKNKSKKLTEYVEWEDLPRPRNWPKLDEEQEETPRQD